MVDKLVTTMSGRFYYPVRDEDTWMQQHEIIVDSSLQELINELTIWQWKKDKNGENLPIPVDKDNHSIDAIRYATELEDVVKGEAFNL